MENEFDINRIKRGKHFSYVDNNGRKISDKGKLDQIKKMRIPPAYRNVKISSKKGAKRYAFGLDDKGRKQFLYSKEWNDASAKEKNLHLINFSKVLPEIKRDIDKNLKLEMVDNDTTRKKLIATALKLVMDCNFRIGSESGVDKYNSFGVSTLTKDHFNKVGGKYNIKFNGKKGVLNENKVESRRLNNSLDDILGSNRNKEIFHMIDRNGDISVKVGAGDVNNYLKKYGVISTKNFRTWMANTHFIDNMMKVLESGEFDVSKVTHRKKIIKKAIDETANKLHHTGSICKKSYVVNELWNDFIEKPADFKDIIMNYKEAGSYKNSENSFIKYMDNYKKFL